MEARDLAESRLALADTALLGLAALAVVALVRLARRLWMHKYSYTC